MSAFLDYVPGTSLIHRLNPITKLFFSFIFAVACFCTSNIFFLLGMLVFAFCIALSCGMRKQTVGLMKAVALFSLLLALIQILTTPGGTSLIPLPWGSIGTVGLLAGVTTVVRLTAAAIPLFLTFYVTKINDITNSVVKVLHVPYKYAFTFSSTVHFIPVFMNDMKGIMEAQTARGIEFDKGGIINKIRLMVPLCVPLLVSSVRKTNSAAIAAEVRGFNLRTRASGYKQYPFTSVDIGVMVLAVALLVAAIILGVVGL